MTVTSMRNQSYLEACLQSVHEEILVEMRGWLADELQKDSHYSWRRFMFES